MQGVIEIKRWINLTGVTIHEQALGIIITPSNHIVAATDELSEKAIAKKLKSGIGTIVDTGVAINYSGKCSLWYPERAQVIGHNAVSCKIKCSIGYGFNSWNYVGEQSFADKIRAKLVPTLNDGIRRVLKEMSQYYPGEHSTAEYQTMAMQVSVSFTPEQLAVALIEPRAMAALCQKLYKINQRNKNTGRDTA